MLVALSDVYRAEEMKTFQPFGAFLFDAFELTDSHQFKEWIHTCIFISFLSMFKTMDIAIVKSGESAAPNNCPSIRKWRILVYRVGARGRG